MRWASCIMLSPPSYRSAKWVLETRNSPPLRGVPSYLPKHCSRRRGSHRAGSPVASAIALAVSAARDRGEYKISSMCTPLAFTLSPS